MASFKVRFSKSAYAEFRAVPFPFRRQLNQRIMRLQSDPTPSDAVSLTERTYRIVLHGWYILYDSDGASTTILAVRKE